MKTNFPKFNFGDMVRVKATIIRMRGLDNRKYWERFETTNFEAIFLGTRTLQDGKSVGDDWYFEVEKYHKGALVCRRGFNPIKVFLEDLEEL